MPKVALAVLCLVLEALVVLNDILDVLHPLVTLTVKDGLGGHVTRLR
jgi:hypothetical protein